MLHYCYCAHGCNKVDIVSIYNSYQDQFLYMNVEWQMCFVFVMVHLLKTKFSQNILRL
jgi:hypothetical protein